MNHQEKKEIVEGLLHLFTEYPYFFMTRQSRFAAAEISALRKEIYDAGCIMRVAKNTLVKKALEKRQEVSGLAENFFGPTMLFFSKDPIAISKIIVECAKKKKEDFEIVAGVSGDKLLCHQDVLNFSTIPSQDILNGRLLGALVWHFRCLLSLMQEPSRRIARIFDECVKK